MSKEKFNLFLEAKVSKEDRVINYIATKEVVDSAGRIFKVDGMDLSPLKQLKSIYWNHHTEELPIGKATVVRKRGDEVRISVKFAEPEDYGFADTVYKLVRKRIINGGSIGVTANFEDIEYPENKKVGGKKVRMIVNKSMLNEFSITPKPSNLAAIPLNAAIEDGVIDELEANEFKIICKDMMDKDKEETKKEEAKDVASLTARVAELELQLKEQEMEEESKDSIYATLYDEFTQTKDNKPTNFVDELHAEFIEEYNKDSLLDEYFEND